MGEQGAAASLARKPAATEHSHRHWTRQECADLVAGLRAGADVPMLALAHKRSGAAIRERLILMVPAAEKIWRDEADGWLRKRLADDQAYDWLAAMRDRGVEPREDEPDSMEPYTARIVLDRETVVSAVSAVWQDLHRMTLKPESLQRFHNRPELDELICYPEPELRAAGQELLQATGNLLLRSWARECAWPGGGLLDLRWDDIAAADLDAHIQLQELISASVESVVNPRHEKVLVMRLGLAGEEPKTLQAIGESFDLSGERIRQLQAKAFDRLRRAHRPMRASGHAGRIISDLTEDAMEQGLDRGNALLVLAEAALPRCPVVQAAEFLATLTGKDQKTCKHIAAEARTALIARNAMQSRQARERGFAERADARIDRIFAHAQWPQAPAPPPPRDALEPQRTKEDDHGGLWRSDKLGSDVNYESNMELQLLQTLDRAPQIAWFCEQPMAINYQIGSRQRTYYPDLIAVTTDGRCLVIEVKNLMELASETSQAKIAAVQHFCQANDWGFLITDGYRTGQELYRRPVSEPITSMLIGALTNAGVLPWQQLKALRETTPFTHEDMAALALQNGWVFRSRPFRLCIPGAADAYVPPSKRTRSNRA